MTQTSAVVTVKDFEKLDIRVGRVVEVQPFPEGRYSTHILMIDFGSTLGIKKSLTKLAPNYEGAKDMTSAACGGCQFGAGSGRRRIVLLRATSRAFFLFGGRINGMAQSGRHPRGWSQADQSNKPIHCHSLHAPLNSPREEERNKSGQKNSSRPEQVDLHIA
jgi:hypothetical protein